MLIYPLCVRLYVNYKPLPVGHPPDSLNAHAHGARVTFGSGGLARALWQNGTAVSAWVTASVARVKSSFADGLNIDIELAASAPADVAA